MQYYGNVYLSETNDSGENGQSGFGRRLVVRLRDPHRCQV
jgi:hypothetical protein